MSSVVVAQLLYLEAQSVEKPIYMYINSPGGVVTSGLAIYDTMQFVKPPIATLCVGQACSMGSLLLAAGAPGMRRALPNSRIMIHQPSGGFLVCGRGRRPRARATAGRPTSGAVPHTCRHPREAHRRIHTIPARS